MSVTWPKSFRLHTSPTALRIEIVFARPLADDHAAVAIARDLLRSRHPEVCCDDYDWWAASVIPREKRSYVVRIPVHAMLREPPEPPQSIGPPVEKNGGIS